MLLCACLAVSPTLLTSSRVSIVAWKCSDVSKQVRVKLAEEVRLIREADGTVPLLAVILVGSRKDSQTYVSMKTKACAEVGVGAQQYDLPETATTVSRRTHTMLALPEPGCTHTAA